MASQQEFRENFFQGKYKILVDAYAAGQISGADSELIPYLVGSFGFLGRVEEAENLFSFHKKSLPQYPLIASRFFLGMTFTRLSRYDEAKALFVENIREWRSGGSNLRSAFYIYQSIAFFRYFSGLYARAFRYAKRSFAVAMQGLETWKKVYAMDILGHVSVQTGDYHRGMEHLRLASETAELANYRGTAKAILHSQLGYALEHGVDLDKNIRLAKEIIEQNRVKEFYLDSQLLLQLAKAYFIRGEIAAMEAVLDEAAYGIYKNKNRRQSVLLNLSHALVASVSGQASKAFFYIGNAYEHIDESVDNYYSLKLKGFEQRTLAETGRDQEAIGLESTVIRLSHATQQTLALRYHPEVSNRKSSLDPIQLLLEGCNSTDFPSPSVVRKLIKQDNIGLLNLFTPIRTKSHLLWFGIAENGIVVKTNGSIQFLQSKLTKNLYDLLRFICERKSITKQELIEVFWGYKYRSHLHDSLIYNSIYRLRRIAPSLASVLLVGSKIELDSNVNVLGIQTRPKTFALNFNSITDDSLVQRRQLNFRQRQLLAILKTGESIRPKDYAQHFEISRMTATRDLRELESCSLFEAVGNTRSLVYRRQS